MVIALESIVIQDFIKWVTGFIVFIVSLYYTIRHFKIVRSISYIERLNNPAMLQIRSSIDSWVESSKTQAEKLKQLEEDAELRLKIRMFYSLITEIGIAYRHNIVDRKIVCDIYNPVIPEYWNKLEFYILDMRAKGTLLGYSFKMLNKEILKHQKRHWRGRAKIYEETE